MRPRPWLPTWLSAAPRTPARRPKARLAAERLEDRTTPAAVATLGDPVSWWTADGTAADRMGRNNATLVSGATYTAGKVGQAFRFDGVDDRANMPDSESLKLTRSMTIEGWVRVDAVSPTQGGIILFRGDDRGGLDPYRLAVEPNGRFQFSVSSLTGGWSVQAPAPIGQLTHVAATLDDATGQMKLYVNGSLAAQTFTTVRPFANLDPASNPGVGIGNHGGYPTTPHNFPFNGVIDELALYDRAMSAAEVSAIHAAGGDGKVRGTTYVAADFPEVTEGSSGASATATFTLRRVGNLSGQAVVNWATADGTATAGTDYTAASGQVVFEDGEAVKTIVIDVTGDGAIEANETFWLLLTPVTTGYAVGGGLAMIVADDFGVSIENTSAVEGDRTAHYRGAFINSFANFNGLTFGPDGLVYTEGGGGSRNTIRRYNGTTGEFLDTFVQAGRIQGVRDIIFRAGSMYVASINSDEVLRFNATTGAFEGAFVTAGNGGIDSPDGMAFGPDANNDGVPELYVTGWNSHSVVRYDGVTGQPLGTYITAGSGGLRFPFALAFGPDAVFVTSAGTNQILKYDTQTGAFLGVAASAGLNNPRDVIFGPDGLMYVASAGNDRILRFTAAGTYVDDYVPAGASGMDDLRSLVFGPDGNLFVATLGNHQILRFGTESEAIFTLSITAPSTLPVTVTFATADGSAIAGSDYTATTGTVTFAPGFTTATIRVPLLDDPTAEPEEMFTVNLSAPAGAVITDSQALVSILDDDGGPKFFVVDDAAADRAYDYGIAGAPLGSTSLNAGSPKTGSTAPRGAASDKAGSARWVVDANAKVYVYSPAGALLGSWAAGTVRQPEGITTNGTDVWLVDAATDRVYRYAAAAGRRDRTQSPASSFPLAAGNTNPKDLVTDGTSFWVVDDGATDRVFKYTLAGALLGSWAIDPANSSPTGLTIDPNDVRHVWVVDNGTDRVYRYDDAAGRTSGSQSAAASFALAAGNSNPQGIADPPTTGDTTAPAGSGARPAGESVTVRRPRRGEAGPAGGPARVGADWFPADGLDRSPVVVDQPVRKPRRA